MSSVIIVVDSEVLNGKDSLSSPKMAVMRHICHMVRVAVQYDLHLAPSSSPDLMS